MIIWNDKLDNKYDVSVTQLSEYIGLFRLSEDNVVLTEREVHISWGARFGPDIEDVVKWQTWV
jgi:hypothetical protein